MFELRATGFRHPDVEPLVAAVQQEYVELYGDIDHNPTDPDSFELPQGSFFLGYDEGVAVAMGGWHAQPGVKALGGEHAGEIRRMYVAPPARRRGHSRALLSQLEDSARAAGRDVLVLETGKRQTEAISLYLSHWYVPIDPFGYYADLDALFLGKRL